LKRHPNGRAQEVHGNEQVRQQRARLALRRLPIFVVATIPFGLVTFAVFDTLSATILVALDVIFVTLAIEQIR
jgi:hypothetical protein